MLERTLEAFLFKGKYVQIRPFAFVFNALLTGPIFGDIKGQL